jgi:flagellar biosynthetic protein FliQ
VSQSEVVTLATNAILLAAKIAGPVLVAALVVGVVVSIFQSLTQVNDFTLTFAPKLLVIAVILVVAGHYMLGGVVDYTEKLYESIPKIVSTGS